MFDPAEIAAAKNQVIDELSKSGQIGRIERKSFVCFPETSVEFHGGYATDIAGTPFMNGDTVTVVYDGVKYVRTAAVFPEPSFAEGDYVGNLKVIGGADTGEPFLLLTSYANDSGEFIGFVAVVVNEFPDTANSTHTISCETFAETIKPIDPKYLTAAMPQIINMADYPVVLENITTLLYGGGGTVFLDYGTEGMDVFWESLAPDRMLRLDVPFGNGTIRTLVGVEAVFNGKVESFSFNFDIYDANNKVIIKAFMYLERFAQTNAANEWEYGMKIIVSPTMISVS